MINAVNENLKSSDMLMGDVNVKISDGLLGLREAGAIVHVKVGVSSIGSDKPIVVLGNNSVNRIREKLGYSPLADKVMDSIENGSDKILCIPVAPTLYGDISEVVKSGTGSGTMTVTGNPNNAFNVEIKITTQGKRNSAAFIYTLDGVNKSEEITVPVAGVYEIKEAGLMLNFVDGTVTQENSFKVDDSFKFSTSAPTMSNEACILALQKIKLIQDEFEFIHIIGESNVGLWSAASAFQQELLSVEKKPCFIILEAYSPSKDQYIDDYVLELIEEGKTIKNPDIQIVVARSIYKGMDEVNREINNAGIVAGMYSRTPVSQSIGKTKNEAMMGIPKDKMQELTPAGIEEYIKLLDDERFLTFKEYAGLENFYVTSARVMFPEGSDFRYAEDIRVKNKIIRVTRKEALQYIQDDIDLSKQQEELEIRAKFIGSPLDVMITDKEISDYSITVPPNQDIIGTGIFEVVIRYLSRGYIRSITVDIGRKRN